MIKKLTKSLLCMLMGGVIFAGCAKISSLTPPITPSSSLAASALPSSSAEEISYSLVDVSAHNNKMDCWLVISDSVYDVTQFIPAHPGGDEILKACGKDATSLFNGEHEHAENNAAARLPEYKIGIIKNN